MKSIYHRDVVYPGVFTLLPEEEKMLLELFAKKQKTPGKLLVNMDEFDDHYLMEVILPGVTRDDIFIRVEGNKLSIKVLHKDCKDVYQKTQMHEFDDRCFERNVILPRNADTEFVCAEFRHGLLRLHLPKTREKPSFINRQIVVY